MKTEYGITVYDAAILHDLFDNNETSWSNLLCPRVLTIRAVTMQDATVFKFTMQHAAGDAVGRYSVLEKEGIPWLTRILGLHKAAAAFCEGLSGDVHKRSTDLARQYILAAQGKVDPKRQPVRSLLQTQQARDWFDICTSSKLASVKILASKWKTARNNAARWQTIHFPRKIIEMWQEMAREADVKVSRFNLLASWIHLVRDSSTSLFQYLPPSVQVSH
jgi:hypothetical protein